MDLVSVEGEPILLAGGKVVTRPDIVAPQRQQKRKGRKPGEEVGEEE